MLVASGDFNPQPGQGSLIQHRDLLINELGNLHQPSNHRSIYLLMLRNSMPPELTPFNLPDGASVAGKRDVTTLPTQSLYLLNNTFIVDQSKRFADLIMSAAKDDRNRIQAAYRHAFARDPSGTEMERAHDFIRDADFQLSSSQQDGAPHIRDVWAAFCQALLASNELRYVD